MTTLDYVVILLFTGLILLAGLSFSRQGGSDMKSFFAAGGEMPWQISGLSLFMSFFSAGTFVVWGAIAYQHGWVAVTIQWMMGLGGFAIGYFIAPAWRKTRALTAAEFIRQRLGTRVQRFYTYIFLLLSFFYTGAFLYPVAKLVNVSTGFSIEWSILILGITIMLYTSVGGLWAVVVTDVLQFVILTAAVLIVVPLALDRVNGLSGLAAQVPADFMQLINGEYTLGFLIAFALYNTCFIGGNWAYVQRYTSVKDAPSARKVGYLFAGLYLISPVLWMLPPMIYHVLNGNLSGLESEGAYLLMCQEVLPAGMLGLMLGGMIFATASSVNTTLNLSAAVFTNDIFKELRPRASEQKLMQIARLSTVAFGIVTIGVAMLVPLAGGIVEVVLTIGALTGVPLYGPPIWALFSRRQTGTSVLAVTLVSLGINAFFKFISPALLGISLNRAEEMALGVAGPLILLAAYELRAYYQHRVSDQYQRYAQQQTTRAAEVADASASSQNRFALKVMALSLLAVGLLVVVLGLREETGQLITLTVGVGIWAVAAWLWHIKRKMITSTNAL
ncbi:MAG: sodium:solute symporter family protein [Tunicatimonas sp.]